MKRLITSHTMRVVAALFGMCLLLSACDIGPLVELTEPAAAEGAATSSQDTDRGRSGAKRKDGSGRKSRDKSGDDGTTDGPSDEPAPVPGDGGGDPVPGDGGGDPVPGDGGGDPVPGDGGGAFACDHTIAANLDEADGATNYSAVRAGDTVCLAAGTRGPLELRNFHGADGQAITFVNDGGTVDIRGDDGDYGGIQIENSDHIRVTGAGQSRACGATVAAEAQRCGIRILGAARSVTGKVKTEHLLVDHVEMGDTTQSAVTIKDNSMARGEWVANDVVLNHNYIHDVYDEGVYIGSSDYHTGDFHVLNGVHLGYNLVVRTGRDGLQVGSTTRDCTIHHNVIRNTGRNNDAAHLKGIVNNKGSVCDIFGNFIADTTGWGIYVQGNGGNEVYNNVIVRAGRAGSHGDGDGIAIHDGSNVDNHSIYVWNNTVVSARGVGIDWNSDVGSANEVRNNLVVASGEENIERDPNVDVSSNFTAPSVAAAAFVDPSSDNYRLQSGAPARDAGAQLSGVVDDFDGVRRPQGSAHDVGAFEFQSP